MAVVIEIGVSRTATGALSNRARFILAVLFSGVLLVSDLGLSSAAAARRGDKTQLPDLVEKLSPAVVNISTSSVAPVPSFLAMPAVCRRNWRVGRPLLVPALSLTRRVLW